jgi:hypothetical protein
MDGAVFQLIFHLMADNGLFKLPQLSSRPELQGDLLHEWWWKWLFLN